MSQAPYALRDARFGTKLGLDLKVRLPAAMKFWGFILRICKNGYVVISAGWFYSEDADQE